MQSSQITIKAMRDEYIAGFHACLDEVARERRWLGLTQASSLDSTRSFVQRLLDSGGISFVALDDQTVVGWIDISVSGMEGFTHQGHLGMGLLEGY